MQSTNGHVAEPQAIAPPHNIEAEEALLGSLIIDNEAIHQVSIFLNPEHFYRASNRWIYEAILDLNRQGEPVDLITLCDLLRQRGKLDDLGGESKILGMVALVPTSINTATYGRIVEEMAVRRGMMRAGHKILNMGNDTAGDIQEQLIASDKLLLEIRNGRTTDIAPRPRQYASEWLDRIERLRESDAPLLGISSPWLDIDKMLLGFLPGQVYYVGARPSMGKSSFLINLAAHWTIDLGKRGLLWTGEMSTSQILDRVAAERTRIPLEKIRKGDLSNDEHGKIYQLGGLIGDGGLIIDETAGINPSQLRAVCHREHMTGGLDFLLVDYIGLMTPDRYLGSKNGEVTEISQALVNIARTLKIPVVAASQLSRAVESRADKRPTLADLRDSGSLEQDGYAIMFLYRDDFYNELSERPNITDIIIPKHRDGATGTVSLTWQKHLTAFRNYQKKPLDLPHYKNGNGTPDYRRQSSGR